MVGLSNPDLMKVDWSKIPVPDDDGAAAHLEGMRVPDIALPATNGDLVSLARLSGRSVLYAYPRTGVPGQNSLVADWDMIPGARGCTPQSCSFRDHSSEILGHGVRNLYGLSTQDSAFQREAAARLHLPFSILSDENLSLTRALRLPTMKVAGITLLKRLSLIVENGLIIKLFYPVFPPDENAARVLTWLRANPTQS